MILHPVDTSSDDGCYRICDGGISKASISFAGGVPPLYFRRIDKTTRKRFIKPFDGYFIVQE